MGVIQTRAKVSVALVGVGPTWERHYRGAIQRLASKLSVRVVCDSVQMRAAVVSDEYEATPVSCPWSLTQRKDLHAWLILDPGWFDTYPATLAVQSRRPALYGNTFCSSMPGLLRVFQQAHDQGEMLMPEFPQRFSPATIRLRELIATKLGAVRRVEINQPCPFHQEMDFERPGSRQSEFIELIDWSNCIVGSANTSIDFQQTPNGLQWNLQFPQRQAKAFAPTVTIQSKLAGSPCRIIECEHGTATISDDTQIRWQTSSEQADESLSHERSPHEIILDQFCRRALGGLVPVPTVADALHAARTAQSALEAMKKSSFDRG